MYKRSFDFYGRICKINVKPMSIISKVLIRLSIIGSFEDFVYKYDNIRQYGCKIKRHAKCFLIFFFPRRYNISNHVDRADVFGELRTREISLYSTEAINRYLVNPYSIAKVVLCRQYIYTRVTRMRRRVWANILFPRVVYLLSLSGSE